MKLTFSKASRTVKKIIKAAEEIGWNSEIYNDTITFSLADVTEDFSFTLSIKNMYQDLIQYYSWFDPEQHCLFWCHEKYNNTITGIPSIHVLLKEAEQIDESLEKLGNTMYKIIFGENTGSCFGCDVIDYEWETLKQ